MKNINKEQYSPLSLNNAMTTFSELQLSRVPGVQGEDLQPRGYLHEHGNPERGQVRSVTMDKRSNKGANGNT